MTARSGSRVSFRVLALCAAAAAAASAADVSFGPGARVTALSEQNYAEEVIHGTSLWVVLFYRSSQAQSQVVVSEFGSASETAKTFARFGAADADGAGATIAESYGIQHFPSIFLFPSELEERVTGEQRGLTKVPVPYAGKSNAAAIAKWVTAMLPDKQIFRIDSIEAHEDFLDAFKTDDMQHVILFTDKPKAPPMYRALSLDLRYRVLFGIAGGDPDWRAFLEEKYDVKERPAVLARPPYDSDGQSGGQTLAYSGKLQKEDLADWLAPMALPVESVPEMMQKDMLLAAKLRRRAKDRTLRAQVKELTQATDLDTIKEKCLDNPRVVCAVAHLDGSEKWLSQKVGELQKSVDGLAKKGRVDVQFLWVDASQSTATYDFFDVGGAGGMPSVTFFRHNKDGSWRYQNLRGSFASKSIQVFFTQSVSKGGGTKFDPAAVPAFSTDEVEVPEVTEDE
eukprot:TRINITY_DN3629_c2_g1_i2.p1 TRINITY_DN3629_c2_g1~~TRINITY_DN3629_c2_g1_i2.p1  ORF type:complete len:475 (+),score=154.27 TRINITY_DN3629_c2_g1_i2:69-1427(+)